MHVASVSKLMTAMAMMVLFRDHPIFDPPWDAPIYDYLPNYWEKGPNIGNITFRNLFNHTAGLPEYFEQVPFHQMTKCIAHRSSLLLRALRSD